MKYILLSMAALSFSEAMANEFTLLDGLNFSGEIRPRYEAAREVDNGPRMAQAFTARTTLAIEAKKTVDVVNLSSYIEFSAVNNFGYTDYNAGDNPAYDVIDDPQQYRLTQVYMDFTTDESYVRAGRQILNIDNERFFGSNNWRQMFQTFDAFSIVDNSYKPLLITASYIFGTNGINVQENAQSTSSLVLNMAYKPKKYLHVTPYVYMLASTPTFLGSDTYGIRFDGDMDINSDLSLHYDFSYAKQSNASLLYSVDESSKIDASYYSVGFGSRYKNIYAMIKYESLGKAENESADGFSTPYASLHDFNGWADIFVTRIDGSGNNKNGLSDANIELGYNASVGDFIARYHSFSAESGEKNNLGNEIDIAYIKEFDSINGFTTTLKGAYYKKGDSGIGSDFDVEKVWVQLDYKFTI